MNEYFGDLMAMTERQQWRARDAAWWLALTKKRRGEMAEAAFLHKASMLGFGVSKPWGDSEPYDLIVDSGSGLWRVQVKSAYRCNENGGFAICAHGSRRKKSYSPKEIDVLVAYIVPEDLWYVLPVTLFRKTKSLTLFPKPSSPSKYNVNREAWRLLGGKP